MFYVPDGTEKCGYYECMECGYRFLSLSTEDRIECPDCEGNFDYEIGPDDTIEESQNKAKLIKIIEGVEEVEKMDTLLSLAITGGDYEWI